MGGDMTLRRNDICYYDYQDGGPWNPYGRIWKVEGNIFYMINGKGELYRTYAHKLVPVKDYQGRWIWRTDQKTGNYYARWHRMPSLRKLKQTGWFPHYYRTGTFWRDDVETNNE